MIEIARQEPHYGQKALVLLSGGQDSATCLLWAKAHFDEVHSIAFNYGQKHAIELDAATTIVERVGVESHRVVSLVSVFAPSALLDNSIQVTDTHAKSGLPATFTAGRNIVFLATASGIAYSLDISALVTGVCQTDYSGYPDCRASFVQSMTCSCAEGLGVPAFAIHTPLMHLTKADTWDLAFRLAGDSGIDIIRQVSHTCYDGDHNTSHEWGYGCGVCPACKLRENGWNVWRETEGRSHE